jgi:DNA-binding HxlR family transcriptional regulator
MYDRGVPATSPYDMYCPISRALDILGERWTLLILRELSMGDQRFTDLKRSVVGIPPNVLSSRLKALVDHGVVATKELPPPAARTVYTLTPRGREALPILRSLARWGFAELEDASADLDIPPRMVANAGFIPFYDKTAAEGIAERYLLVVDGQEQWLSTVRGERPPAGTDPDLTLEGPSWAFVAARQRTTSLTDLIEDGVVRRTKGTARTQRTFERVFSLG